MKKLMDTTTQVNFLVRNPVTGKEERVTGQKVTYTNGDLPKTTLYGINPNLAKDLGIDLTQVLKDQQVEGTPTQFEDVTIPKNFEIDKDLFDRALFDSLGEKYILRAVDSASASSSSSTTSAYKELGNSKTNTIFTKLS